jgi:hypothetical protein
MKGSSAEPAWWDDLRSWAEYQVRSGTKRFSLRSVADALNPLTVATEDVRAHPGMVEYGTNQHDQGCDEAHNQAYAQAQSAEASQAAVSHQEAEGDQNVEEPDHHCKLGPTETPHPVRKAAAEGLNRHENRDRQAQQRNPRRGQHKAGDGCRGPGVRATPRVAVLREETQTNIRTPAAITSTWPSSGLLTIWDCAGRREASPWPAAAAPGPATGCLATDVSSGSDLGVCGMPGPCPGSGLNAVI